MEGPLPGSPPALHPRDPRLQADALGRRLLARQREEPAAPAHLRHRLGVPREAGRIPRLPRGGREARPPQAGRRARPVLLPRRTGLRPAGLPPQGRRDPQGDGGLLAQEARGGRLLLRQHAPHHQGQPLQGLRPPRLVRRRHVPAHGARGRALLPQADELPDAQPDLPRRAAAPTASCRCAPSSSARSTATRSPAWSTA